MAGFLNKVKHVFLAARDGTVVLTTAAIDGGHCAQQVWSRRADGTLRLLATTELYYGVHQGEIWYYDPQDSSWLRSAFGSKERFMALTAAEVMRRRDDVMADVSVWYSPLGHLATSMTLGIGALAWAISVVDTFGRTEALWVAAVWVASNASEWRLHKSLLHHRVRFFERLFERHTPHHHGMFADELFYVRSTREWRFVLLPPWGIAGIVGIIVVVSLPLAWLGQPNLAALFVATGSLYVMSYEWLHLAYHQPPDSLVGRNRLIGWLRQHHADHHRPENMQQWDFNVTLPLWDWVRGTTLPR